MKETVNKTVLDLNDIDSDILIGRYDFSIDEEGRTIMKPSVVSILPEIVICKTIGNTRYSVFGKYCGSRHLEDKISGIIKREMEV